MPDAAEQLKAIVDQMNPEDRKRAVLLFAEACEDYLRETAPDCPSLRVLDRHRREQIGLYD